MKVLSWLRPKEDRFFDALTEQAKLAHVAASKLDKLLGTYDGLPAEGRRHAIDMIKRIERHGDELHHEVLADIDKAFITPIDKEDLRGLSMLLDDLIDMSCAVAIRMRIFNMDSADEPMRELAGISAKAATQVLACVSHLRELRPMREEHLAIHRLEKEADEVYQEALSRLFHTKTEPVDLVRRKELYSILESITDHCKQLSHVVGSIVVKHA